MELKELLEKFTLEGSDERKCIGNNPFTALQEPPQKFQEVAKAILSGHFRVQNSSTSEHIEVHPTCVEIYYHEEQNNGVKDPIVYHRNRETKSGKNTPSVFPLGVLHNHVSGIDITFESEADNSKKYVTGIVRASALIRKFKVKDKDGKWMEFTKIKNNEDIKSKIEDRSTYIYEYLFGQFSIFDGFTIKWVDGGQDFDDIKLKCNPRKNVKEYRYPTGDEYDYQKEGRQCKRAWQFVIES